MKAKIDFTKINNDVNGNPRYVCHFLNLLNIEDRYFPEKEGYLRTNRSISEQYEIAVKRAKKLGGKKYHNKKYGGGIVFQSYNIRDLEKSILDLLKQEKDNVNNAK